MQRFSVLLFVSSEHSRCFTSQMAQMSEYRFRPAKTFEQEEKCGASAIPKSTQYINKWAVGISEEWPKVRVPKVQRWKHAVYLKIMICAKFSPWKFHCFKGWFSLAHKHKHKKLRSKWEHQDISIRAYAGAVITKFLDTSFPQLQSRWRIITLMLISLAFALRHKHSISIT